MAEQCIHTLKRAWDLRTGEELGEQHGYPVMETVSCDSTTEADLQGYTAVQAACEILQERRIGIPLIVPVSSTSFVAIYEGQDGYRFLRQHELENFSDEELAAIQTTVMQQR